MQHYTTAAFCTKFHLPPRKNTHHSLFPTHPRTTHHLRPPTSKDATREKPSDRVFAHAKIIIKFRQFSPNRSRPFSFVQMPLTLLLVPTKFCLLWPPPLPPPPSQKKDKVNIFAHKEAHRGRRFLLFHWKVFHSWEKWRRNEGLERSGIGSWH